MMHYDCFHAAPDGKGGSQGFEEMSQRRGLAAAWAWALLLAPCGAAYAGDSAPPVAVAARLIQDADSARLVFDVSRPVDAHVYALSAPDRMIVDLPEVNFQVDPSLGRGSVAGDATLIKAFRFGLLAPGKSRIVIDLARPACPTEVGSKPIVEGEPASRLNIELKPCEAEAFAALVRSPGGFVANLAPSPSSSPPSIVLDPGHGGADGGARGVGGAVEKILVFDFCAELKRQLEATRRYEITMTRAGDEYVDLDDRVTMARDANAALFISVHADTLSDSSDVSGSTVYTAAEHASDAEAARVAAHENAAGQQLGKKKATQDDPGVADILFDLKRRETRAYAHIFSRGLVDRMRGAARLNHNPERSAGFVVLKAPEFPSVLVELGYLSNLQDVQAMRSPEWRAKTAAAMVKAIDAFFAGPGRPGGAASEPGVALGGEKPAAAPVH
jgi:N-acetylmuramoyl-L-alanine amidase